MTLFHRKDQRGYLFVELLTALTLFSVAGSSLYSGFLEGTRCHRRIEESQRRFNAPKLSLLRLEEDLRNMTALRDHPFEGTSEEMRFPALLAGEDEKGAARSRLVLIRYLFENGRLLREESELTAALDKPDPVSKTLLENLDNPSFRYPFRDPEGAVRFEEAWPEDNDAGLPRAVRVTLYTAGLELQKIFSIPHGRFAEAETGKSGGEDA